MTTTLQPRGVSPWIHLATIFGMFVAGGFIGLGLSSWSAPGSGIAAAFSVLMLPVGFAAGLLLWAGLRLLTAIIAASPTRRSPRAAPAATAGRPWFTPLCLASSTAVGCLVGILPGGAGVFTSMLAYGATGSLYGLLLTRLAGAGYLPAPDIH